MNLTIFLAVTLYGIGSLVLGIFFARRIHTGACETKGDSPWARHHAAVNGLAFGFTWPLIPIALVLYWGVRLLLWAPIAYIEEKLEGNTDDYDDIC